MFGKLLLALFIFINGGDGLGHKLKNAAYDQVIEQLTENERNDKDKIRAELEKNEAYKLGVEIEGWHDAIGEKKNPKPGFQDEQQGIFGGILGQLDFFDLFPDKTIMEKPVSTDNGKEVIQDTTVAVFKGKVTQTNFSVKHEQEMTGILDFRRVENYYRETPQIGEIEKQKYRVGTNEVRVLKTYPYINLYGSYPDKIEIEGDDKVEKTDDTVTISSTIKVYQDSFEAKPTPNKKQEEQTKFGFIFKEDPLTTEDEFEKEVLKTIKERAMYPNFEHLTKEEASKVAQSRSTRSYYASKGWYEDHLKEFEKFSKKLLEATAAESAQTSFAFYCSDLWFNAKDLLTKDTLAQLPDNFKIINKIKIRVYKCKFEDREKEENKNNFQEFMLEEIDWPEKPEDIEKVIYLIPLIRDKEDYQQAKKMTEKELEKKKKETINADSELPQIQSGEDSEEQEIIYSIYDWDNIKDIKDEEQTQDGQASIIDIGTKNYTAEYVPEIGTVFIGKRQEEDVQEL